MDRPILSEHITPPRPEAAEMTVEQLHAFWQWQWQDDQNRHWQVKPERENMDPDKLFCAGSIIVTAPGQPPQEAGVWERSLMISDDDAVEHGKLELEEEFRGSGFAGAWLEHCAQKYEDWDIKQVRINATGFHGAAAWPKLGFSFDVPGPEDSWDSPWGQQMSNLLDQLSTDWPEDDQFKGFKSQYENDPEFLEFRKTISDMAQRPAPPTMKEALNHRSEFIRPLMYETPMALVAAPGEILEAIHERGHEKSLNISQSPSLSL